MPKVVKESKLMAQRNSKRPLRADAVRNQALILDAARAMFAAHGLDVPLDAIAQRAGVGVATLYRGFPDRERLVLALFEKEMDMTIELARIALDAVDPWEGFSALLRSIFRMVAEDKGLRYVLLGERYGLESVTAGRAELIKLLSQVVARTQNHGSLRPGFSARDIPIMMLMVGVAADFAGDVQPEIWQRYGALLIDGISTRRSSGTLMPDPLSEKEMVAASAVW